MKQPQTKPSASMQPLADEALEAPVGGEAKRPEDAPTSPPTPDISALMAELAELRSSMAKMQGQVHDAFPDDDKLYIRQPNGRRWTEPRRVDKTLVDVEFTMSAFYGPFATEEAMGTYLAAKASKRPGNDLLWEGVSYVTGREKRQIEAQERDALAEGDVGYKTQMNLGFFANRNAG